jgi:hypothetical protein
MATARTGSRSADPVVARAVKAIGHSHRFGLSGRLSALPYYQSNGLTADSMRNGYIVCPVERAKVLI